jgi:hypothetical protein
MKRPTPDMGLDPKSKEFVERELLREGINRLKEVEKIEREIEEDDKNNRITSNSTFNKYFFHDAAFYEVCLIAFLLGIARVPSDFENLLKAELAKEREEIDC